MKDGNSIVFYLVRNHWGLLLQVADKAKIALAVSSTSNMLAIKEALEELEAVK